MKNREEEGEKKGEKEGEGEGEGEGGRDVFGVKGDFITSPEVSQMFGESIGALFVDCWHRLGSPSSFNLVEVCCHYFII